MARFEPQDVLVLTTAKQTKAYLHPVRARILSMLSTDARTNSQIARSLGVHPANLTHHFRKLRGAGLIKIVATRSSGRGLEKFYRATARQFDVEPDDDAFDNKCKVALSILRRDLTIGIRKLPGDDSAKIVTLLKRSRVRAADVGAFRKKLEALVEEFRTADAEGGESYSLNLSLYPNDSDYGPVRKIVIK
ncbi:MAG: helix-turn-helix domain-containing protein [Parvularculaceae bacterium]